jgi:hypothetical protein
MYVCVCFSLAVIAVEIEALVLIVNSFNMTDNQF